MIVRVLVLLLLAFGVPSPVAADDFKKAPPLEELDRRADEYITNRRIVAVLLIGGTLIGGMIGSISRRRAKARAARERAEGSHGDQGSDRSD